MDDLRQILVTALYTKLSLVCTNPVYSKMPRAADVTYPYNYISDIYDDENGPKTGFQYRYDVLIQVIFKNISSKSAFYSEMAKVKSIINNAEPFTLTGGFKIKQCILNNSSDTDIEVDDGVLTVGLVRAYFDIDPA